MASFGVVVSQDRLADRTAGALLGAILDGAVLGEHFGVKSVTDRVRGQSSRALLTPPQGMHPAGAVEFHLAAPIGSAQPQAEPTVQRFRRSRHN